MTRLLSVTNVTMAIGLGAPLIVSDLQCGDEDVLNAAVMWLMAHTASHEPLQRGRLFLPFRGVYIVWAAAG